MTNDFKKCINCEKLFYPESIKQCELCGEFYCLDCYNDLFITCEICGKKVCSCCTNVDTTGQSQVISIICSECWEKGVK
ncbi:MAG: hypothetical protein ACFFC1_18550 [Promethearchaeota archaeon]